MAESELQLSTHHIPNSIGWFLARVLGLLFLVNTLFVLFLVVTFFLSPDFYTLSLTFLWIIFTLQFIFSCVIITRLTVQWGGTQYYLKENQLICYKSFLERNEAIYDLRNLKTVVLIQGTMGRILNYGDIKIVVSSSGYKEDVSLEGIFDPKKYERIIREYLQ